MALLSLEHLRGDIVGRTADRALALTVELELGRQTEVTDLDLHLVVKEEVAELEISVDDAMTVKVFDCRTDLIDVTLDFELVEALPTAQQLVQRLVLAQLEENIDVLCVLEEVFEADDVVLVEGAMDLDFRHQLLLGTSLSQSGLRNYFSG